LSTDRVPLEASRLRRSAGLQGCTDALPSQIVNATILVRRRPAAGRQQRIEEIIRGDAPPLSREQAAELLGADPQDLRQVIDFAVSYGMNVTGSSTAQRNVKISGTVVQMESAFCVKLHACQIGRQTYVFYEGALTIPASLDQVIVGILGLDQRPVARP
jgi:kumamolisin